MDFAEREYTEKINAGARFELYMYTIQQHKWPLSVTWIKFNKLIQTWMSNHMPCKQWDK